ncbi:MAG: hypothetical protein VB127_06300 [Sphaerochaeta sp.]|nr:hypothetical protein [Sphaerochaeta sp.]
MTHHYHRFFLFIIVAVLLLIVSCTHAPKLCDLEGNKLDLAINRAEWVTIVFGQVKTDKKVVRIPYYGFHQNRSQFS